MVHTKKDNVHERSKRFQQPIRAKGGGFGAKRKKDRHGTDAEPGVPNKVIRVHIPKSAIFFSVFGKGFCFSQSVEIGFPGGLGVPVLLGWDD